MHPATNGSASRTWHTVAVAALLLATLAAYLGVCRALPYYYNWDMDLMASVDTLVVNGGDLPVHIAHPGFGLYLVNAATQRLAHAAGVLSAVRLEDLATSLDPLAVMAEHTATLRLHSPLVAWATVILLWLALRRIVRPRAWADVGLLALVASQDGLLYQAGLVRSELYAVLFWSVALLLVATVPDARARRTRALLLVAAGVALGLCYLTKLQSLFLLAAVPLVLVAQASARATSLGALLPTHDRRAALRALAVAGLALALLAALLLAAAREPDPDRQAFMMFTASWPLRLNATGAAVLAGSAAVALLLAWLVRRGRWAGDGFAFVHAVALLLLGFVASFALHVLPYDLSATGIRYLLYDAKMLFFRSSLTIIQVADSPLEQVWWQLRWDAALFALLAVAAVVSAATAWRARREPPARAAALAVLGLALLAVANAALAVRFNFRDLIWVQTLALVAAVTATPLLCARRAARVATIVLLALALVGQLLHGRDMVARLESNFNVTGFDDERWLSGFWPLVGGGSYARYAQIMEQHYGDAASPRRAVARRSARASADHRRIVDYVLQEPGVDLRRIGVLSEGFPLRVAAPDARIVELPEALREAIVVDPSGATGGGPRFVPERVRTHSGLREKIAGTGEPGSLALLPRPDLRVFLFHAANDDGAARLPACASRDAGPPPAGGLTAGDQAFVGREITTYCVVPAADVPSSAVVVIQYDDQRAKGPLGARRTGS